MSNLSAPLLVAGQNLFSTSATQNAGIGTYAETTDGRGFRYTLAGAVTLVPGKLQQGPAEDTTNFQNLAVTASAIGSLTVTTSTTVTLTANQVAGGTLIVTTSTGAGYVYRIASHPAATAAAVTFTLEDPIIVATTTSSRIDVQPSPYAGVVVNPSTATSAPVGVAVFAVVNAQYGWIQTHGPAPILADGTVVVGTAVVASNATAGAVEALTGVQAPVGTAVTGAATTEYGLVFLTID